MNPRSTLSKEVQSRLAAGESKSDIYTALKTKFPARSMERSLAQWPLPAVKKQTRSMNVPIIIIAVFFALLTVFSAAPVISSLTPGQIIYLFIILMIQLYTVYGVIHCNLIGYMLLILMSLRNILMILQAGISDPKLGMLLAMSAAAILLSVLQKRKLFPNTSWLLRHKRDSDGNPIF